MIALAIALLLASASGAPDGKVRGRDSGQDSVFSHKALNEYHLSMKEELLASASGAPDGKVRGRDSGQDTIFSHKALNEYHLSMKQEDFEWLNHHELLEKYVPGNVTFVNNVQDEGVPELYEKAGIRYKGSKGSLEFCFSNATGNEGSGPFNKRLCKKLSMKVSFDYLDDNLRFHGMKKIQLHAMMNDPSMMRECLAYGLYRKMGVHVPRCAHAKVFINGEYSGVYMAVEYIDSRFLKHHFGEKDGVLLKEKWPAITTDAASAEYYLAGVRNRKSSTTAKDLKPIVKFSEKVLAASTTGEVAKLLRKHWNMDSLLNTLVVASVIDDWDSFFTFFPNDPNHHTPTALAASAAANVSGMPKHRFNHNYYIYQDREGLLNFIQWDTDLTFSEYGSVVELFFGCPQWRVPLCQVADGVSSVYCTKCFEYEPYNVSQGTPGPGGLYPAACDLIVNAIATEMQEEVLQRMWDFLRSHFRPDALETIILEWKDLVREAHECDPNYPAGKDIFPDPSKTNTTLKVNWTEEVSSLIGTVKNEYKRALVRSNPVYRPRTPDRKNIEKVFACVKDCSQFIEQKGIKSLYTCYQICLFEVPLESGAAVV